MTSIALLQDWYLQHCDGDWEHDYGIQIDTLDNPGWSLKINLRGTDLEDIGFTAAEHGVGAQSIADDPDWWTTKVEDGFFIGFSGPKHLDTLLDIFLQRAKKQILTCQSSKSPSLRDFWHGFC